MVTVSEFGKLSDGTSVSKYTIKNAAGMELQVLDLGAILQSAIVPDKDGKMIDVTLGYDTVEPYAEGMNCFGGTIGRHANRIKNGTFEIDGVTYQLFLNDGINNLQYRYRAGTGIGYQWLEGQTFESTGKWSFNQEVGLTYIKEKYEHASDDDRCAFRYAHHAAWTPRWVDKLSFTHNLEYLPDVSDWEENYLIDADVGCEYALDSAWTLFGKIEWDYNSNPGPHTKKSDFRYTLGVGYKW